MAVEQPKEEQKQEVIQDPIGSGSIVPPAINPVDEAARLRRIAEANEQQRRRELAAEQQKRDAEIKEQTQVASVDTSKKVEVHESETQTSTVTIPDAETLEKAEEKGTTVPTTPEEAQVKAQEIQEQTAQVQEQKAKVEANLAEIDSRIKEITGGLTQQQLVDSIERLFSQLESQKQNIMGKTQDAWDFRDTTLAQQSKAYEALERSIRDKITRGVYKSQRELDEDLNVLENNRKVLNEFINDYNERIDEVNQLSNKYNADYNRIVQGSDYQNLQEVNRYLAATDTERKFQEAEEVNDVIAALENQIEDFNKSLEILSLNRGEMPESYANTPGVQINELRAAIEGTGLTDTQKYEDNRPILSAPEKISQENEQARLTQIEAYRQFRSLVEERAKETGIMPQEDEIKKAFFEAYNLGEGNFEVKAQILTGISNANVESPTTTATPTITSSDLRSPNEDGKSDIESFVDAAGDFREELRNSESVSNLRTAKEEQQRLQLEGQTQNLRTIQEGSILGFQGLFGSTDSGKFNVKVAESPEEFQRKMAFLIELGIQAGKESLTNQEFSKIAQQTAKELGVDLSTANLADLRENLALEFAKEVSNVQQQVNYLNNIIYDPTTSIDEKNAAITKQQQLIDSLGEYEQKFDDVQPGLRGEIVRILAPASPLDVVLTAMIAKSAAGLTVKGAGALARGAGAVGRSVAKLDLTLSPEAQQGLLRLSGSKFYTGTATRPQVSRTVIRQINSIGQRQGIRPGASGRSSALTRRPIGNRASSNFVNLSGSAEGPYTDAVLARIRQDALASMPIAERQAATETINALTNVAKTFSVPNIEINSARIAIAAALEAGANPEDIGTIISKATSSELSSPETLLQKIIEETNSTSLEPITQTQLQPITLSEESLVEAASQLSTQAQPKLKTQTIEEFKFEPIKEPETIISTQTQLQPIAEPSTQPATEPISQPATQPTTQPATQPTTQPATESQIEPIQQLQPELEPIGASAVLSAQAISTGTPVPFRFVGKYPQAIAQVTTTLQPTPIPVKTLNRNSDEEDEDKRTDKNLGNSRISTVRLIRLVNSDNRSVTWELRTVTDVGGKVEERWGPYLIPEILSSNLLSNKGRNRLRGVFGRNGTTISNGTDLILSLLALGKIGRHEINSILPFEVVITPGDLIDA